MAKASTGWKRGRGKLGPLAPLMGSWVASGDSDLGTYTCRRVFAPILGGSHVELRAVWVLPDRRYEEVAIFGIDRAGALSFWSFTSDGKNARGAQVALDEVHPLALAFEAEMPAGLARQVYWPDEAGGFYWAVEAKNKSGWKRFMVHHYAPEME